MDRFRLDDPDAAEKAYTVYSEALHKPGGNDWAAIRAVLDAIEQPRLPTRSEVEYRLRSALTVARDFIKFHPAVAGEWPMVYDLIDEVLALGATEDPEPEVDPAQVEVVARVIFGGSDEIWDRCTQEWRDENVAAARRVLAWLASGRVQVTPQ